MPLLPSLWPDPRHRTTGLIAVGEKEHTHGRDIDHLSSVKEEKRLVRMP